MLNLKQEQSNRKILMIISFVSSTVYIILPSKTSVISQSLAKEAPLAQACTTSIMNGLNFST